ncbi:MAG: SGNH/GDSL hydrolase family protein [Cyanobacteria bacterium P01_H01_bin.26]
MGNPPLYIADDTIGYLLAPNQRVRRFGNLIAINQYSMRSHTIEPSRPPNTLRVFLIGDSVVNGNWWTDQSQTLSTRVQTNLSQHSETAEVLNASANSWGPRNELAYLQRFGTFGAQIVILVINTDDLFGTKPSSIQVGHDRRYPDKKPPLAILEVANRSKKQSPVPGLKDLQNESGDRVGKNLAAIQAINTRVETSGGQLLLAMTPLKREVLERPKDYEVVARHRVDEVVAQETIPYLDLLQTFQIHPEPDTLYRDHIHLSPAGNTLVAQALTNLILQARLPAPTDQ